MEEFRFTFDPDKYKKENSEESDRHDENEISEENASEAVLSEISAKETKQEDTLEEKIHSEGYGSYINNLRDTVNLSEVEFDEEDLNEEGYEEDTAENEDGEIFPDENISKEEKRELRMQKKAEKRLESKRDAAEKKLLKTEAKKHKGNYIIYYIAFGLIFVIIAVTLSLTVLFNVSKIEVEGCSAYSADEIAEASGISSGDNMFLTSYSHSRQRICSSLPYVRNVNFECSINGIVTIKVEETYDYMVVACKAGFAVLSPEKKVLRISVDSYPNNLVHIFGLDASEAIIGKDVVFESQTAETIADELIPQLIKCGFTSVTDINVSDTSAIKVVYDGRIQMDLGTSDNFEYKLTFAKQAIDSSIESDAVGVLNLSQLSSTNREVQFRRIGFYSVTQ